jgi:DNA-directed RNA polymerase I, II, and III subunit RPABC2
MDPEDEYNVNVEDSDYEESDIEIEEKNTINNKNVVDDDDMDKSINDDIDDDDDEFDDDDDDEFDLVASDDEDKKQSNNNKNQPGIRSFELSDSEEESDDEDYLQKFDEHVQNKVIEEFHPELQHHNYEEINNLTTVVRNEDGIIIDPLHKTLPFITRYEKARIIGERAKQLNSGASPMIDVEPSVLDGYLIALKEFEEKLIPFIVKRPLPNGGCEYWKLSDLEILV